MQRSFIFILFTSLTLWLSAQVPVQNIKGRVIDVDAKSPLAGATVFLADSTLGIGTETDTDGYFLLENVPIGRQQVKCSYFGYANYLSPSIILTSAKEYELSIEMQEQIKTEEAVIITANEEQKTQAKPVNEFSTISTRSFSIEQVQRYPATMGDPARMAMAFPGVQASRDYQNDIIIRGNSPAGLLWRLEGVDIINPNHFARIGGSGGSITIFSLSLMGESDFSTGAFAPEYGNATSGVFDMKFRKGNMEKYEFTGRAGMIGLDLATEGPIKKGKSSFLANYRYSTLGLISKLGFRLSFSNGASAFQDLSFNIYSKVGKNGSINFFGVGGDSRSQVLGVKDTTQWNEYDDRYLTDYKTRTAATGISYNHLLDEKSYIKAAVAFSGQAIDSYEDLLFTKVGGIDTLKFSKEKYRIWQVSSSVNYVRKFSARTTLKTGLISKIMGGNISNLTYNGIKGYLDTLQSGTVALSAVIQPYAQLRYRINEKLTFTGGVHALYFTLNNSSAIEPRASLSWQFHSKQNLTLAYGLHSQVIPIGTYYATQFDSNSRYIDKNADGSFNYTNMGLKLPKAHHFILSYHFNFLEFFKVKAETYFQYMYHLPVMGTSYNPTGTDALLVNSTNMMYNDRFGYGIGGLQSKGTGQNYGLDLTVERFFSNRMFFLLNSSVFRSQYQAANGKTYSTRYDNRFSSSLLLGKEWEFKSKGALEAGFRVSYTGGLRYTPSNIEQSRQYQVYVPIYAQSHNTQFPNVFRIDTRVAYRWNGKRVAYLLSLDFQNITNRKNVVEFYYDIQTKQLAPRYSSALVPLLNFTIDF
ncbi:MAG: carboxypeptidase-like regulatory domain-containing protein [Bacteroidia bacterium]